MNLGVGLLFVAIAILILVSDELSYAAQRIWQFQGRYLHFTRPRFPWEGRKRKLHADLTDVRDFVVNLQLAVSLNETLSGALIETARQFVGRGIFGERLKKYVESRLALSPEEVIRGMAEDFDAPQLQDLLRRLEISRDGGTTHLDALNMTVEAIEKDIRVDVERELQQAPIRLTTPMVVGVFLAALALGAYPVLLALLRIMSLGS
jgi:hypothetical protein